MTLFCGIDWAETHHDIAIIDGDGQLLVKKRIPGAMRCILLCPMPAISAAQRSPTRRRPSQGSFPESSPQSFARRQHAPGPMRMLPQIP